MEVREHSAKYLAHPGYKLTEVGLIPKDWCEASLTSLTEKGSRITYGVVQPGKNDSDGVLFIRGGDIFAGRIIATKLRRIPKAISEQYKRTCLSGGEILISLVGYPGEVALVPKSLAGANIARQVALVKLNKDLPNNPDFVCKFLQSNVGRRQLLKEAIGSAQQVINLRDIQKVTVALPPTKAEQEAIAEALSDADALIESFERLLAKKRHIKQGAMQELLTGKKRLPGFSGDWEVKRLGDLSEMGSGGTPCSSNPAYYDGDIPWVSISDMTKCGKSIATTDRNLSAAGLNNSAAQMFPVGAVLYAMYASLGECSIASVPVCSSQAILGVRAKGNLHNEFLYYYLCSIKPQVKTMGQQGTQSNLNKRMVQDFHLWLSPTVNEQTAIAALLSDMDADLATLEAKLAKARAIKQGMMQELLTGRIRLVKPGSNAANAGC